MATASSLISRIHSAVQNYISVDLTQEFLKMGLRNIKVRLVCLRNLGDADKHAIQSLFSRIQDAIPLVRMSKLVRRICYPETKILVVIVCLAEEVNDECERHANAISNHLTLDDVVEVAESLLDTTDYFWYLARGYTKDILNAWDLIRHEIDEFEVQVRFLRDFLFLAKRSAVETQQLQTLLIHLRPFVLKATRMFMIDRTSLNVADDDKFDRKLRWDANWVKEVVSKCPRVDPQIFQSYTQFLMSMSTLDQTADATVLKDFLSSLISLLWHILRYHSDSLKPLYECLRLSRFNLKRNYNNAQIGVLIRDAGILICSVYLSGVDSAYLSDLLKRFDVVQAQVLLESSSLSESVLDFAVSTTIERKVHSGAAMASTQSSSIPQVVSFQDDVKLIEDRIVRGSKQLRLVPICGMAGIGKTTFALEMYNLPSVVYHFQARAWCIISQVFDKKKVMLELLKQIQPGDYSKMMEDDLANKLRQSLKGKRYLILLDDVWTPQVWESLGPSFPDDATQSRIVLTSRLHTIIPLARPDEQPHNLRLRTDDECLDIIQMKLLQAELPQEELEKFASLCKGLPLTAVILAGLLATSEQDGWEGILNHLSSRGMSGVEQCNIALELSYKQLPHYLKPCFLYFGAFPEDEEIYAEKLMRLWMAEGFVAKRNGSLKMRIQDVGREHLDELIQRNLVMVARKKSMGGVKHCRIHDLLHDFCLMKGKQENLFHRLLQKDDGLSDFNEPCNLVRLSIHSTAYHFMESKLFCPLAHSLLHFNTSRDDLFDMWFIIQIYKHLRVLDMDCIKFLTAIPNEIAHLSGLTYLSIRTGVPVIPSSIGNLSNLETLIIHGGTVSLSLSLPHTIWQLENLKCLYITAPFTLPIENLESSPDLLELESVCGLLFYTDGSMEKPMMKFPNIRKLKCHVICIGEISFVIPGFLTQLESLTLYKFATRQCQFDFDSTAKNLRKLTLRGFLLSREEIAAMGKLPKLEALKLEDIDFLEGKMEMEEGEFSKLRVLKLIGYVYLGSKLKMWTAIGDDILPCLEKLVFRYLENLEEIPCSCLKDSSTLVEVDVFRSSRTLESLVRNIEEAQRDFGNSIRVQISGQEE